MEGESILPSPYPGIPEREVVHAVMDGSQANRDRPFPDAKQTNGNGGGGENGVEVLISMCITH